MVWLYIKENGQVSYVILPTPKLMKKIWDFCVYKKINTIILTGRRTTAKKEQWYQVLYHKRVKGFEKWDMVQNFWEKITKKLEFVETGTFIRESAVVITSVLV